MGNYEGYKGRIWDWKSFSITDLLMKIDREELVIPSFQRSLVWDDEEKKELSDTIRKQRPFGCIYLYKYQDIDQNKVKIDKFQLIDGLQRLSTISEYMESMNKFFKIEEEKLASLVSKMNSFIKPENLIRDNNLVRSEIKEWVNKNYRNYEQIRDINGYGLAFWLAEKFNVEKSDLFQYNSVVASAINDVFIEFKKQCESFMNLEIPTIVINEEGVPQHELPDIFNKINSTGKALTKYEKFAASWATLIETGGGLVLNPTNQYIKEIITAIKKRNETRSSKIKILEAKSGKIGHFDVVFGLGQVLSNNPDFRDLFVSGIGETEINSAAFSLLAATLGVNNKNIVKIPERLNKIPDLSLFLTKLLEVTKEVNHLLLNNIHRMKLNSKTGKKDVTQFLIVSIIAVVFHMKYGTLVKDSDNVRSYEFNFETENKDWPEKKKKLIRNLYKRYAMDIFSNLWGHSGHKRVNEIVFTNPDWFTKEVTFEKFNSSIREYFQTKMDERPNSFDKKDEIILSLYYLKRMNAQEINNYYNIDHIVTRKIHNKMKEKKLSLNENIFTNLCFLPEGFNKSKSDRVAHELSTEEISKFPNMSKENLERFTRASMQDSLFLFFHSEKDYSQDDFKEKFELFMSKMLETMIEHIREDHFSNPVEDQLSDDEDILETDIIFSISRNDYFGRGYYNRATGEFTLEPESRVNVNDSTGLDYSKVDHNGFLKEEIAFSSPSAAGSYVFGGDPCNGLEWWRDAEGRTLREVMDIPLRKRKRK